jgi:hypothetical protein
MIEVNVGASLMVAMLGVGLILHALWWRGRDRP